MYLVKIKKFFAVFKDKLYFKAALFYRVFPSVEHDFLWKLSFRTVVDVGANKGQFSLATKKNLKDAKIHAFEPLAKPADKFSKLFKNDDNVMLYKMAIGQKKRKVLMNVSHSDDSSSLLNISELQNNLFPDTYKSGSEMIYENTLESVMDINKILEPSLLKIDVQGYEMEVLKGSHSYLKKFTYIYCECSYLSLYEDQPLASDIVEFLSKNSFELDGIYNTCYTKEGTAIQSDFLFKRIQ